MKDRLLRSLSQESTWRGITALAAAGGIVIEPALADQIIAAALAIIGLINTLKNK